LDVKILSELFGGDNAERDLTPAWDGGLYWAGQLHGAKTPEERASTRSLALFYLSVWRNADSAQVFAKLYGNSLGRKYSNLKPVADTDSGAGADAGEEQVFSTSEGPVVITTRGKMVFVAESFPLPVARKLTALIFDAQGTGVIRMANLQRPDAATGQPMVAPSFPRLSAERVGNDEPYRPLTGDLTHFFQNCGVMKAAVDGAIEGAMKSTQGAAGAEYGR
jgi:hypothetical protein